MFPVSIILRLVPPQLPWAKTYPINISICPPPDALHVQCALKVPPLLTSLTISVQKVQTSKRSTLPRQQ